MSESLMQRSRVRQFLGVVTERQTYRNLLYLLVALPLGMSYYFLLTFGFTLGIALSILVVGLGILAVIVIAVRYLAAFERRLANRLLGTTLTAPTDVEPAGDSLIATTKAYLRAASTWRGLGFVFLKLPLGLLSFILLISSLGTAIELLLLPSYPEGVLHVQIGGWRVAQTFETTTQQIAVAPVGAALTVVSLHILNAFADANATVAIALLGEGDTDENT